MLAKQHRFHGHKSFSFVYRQGATIRSQFMSLKFVRNPRRNEYRAAVIVSRKVHKSAVRRNRIRRRLYEIIRRHEPYLTEPYDLVLTVFSASLIDMPSAKLESIVETLLAKVTKGSAQTKPATSPRAIVKSNEDRV